ncbi:hypothetical protein ADIWIN_1476 [Winogradskyella psychrotolerans RS-3]|uniref:Uncharacterized protein n=1 Tax=Winogradskyella psychrotolerans RS-3 TaxID=641526 RepID=S7VTN9_9FLAO|nr:hypothetical protein [Winogradskyella psychrotolerans]EPR73446.1 hypothetical protein ADIWIN_1476 [Winogradskyella psychrotolerans RS-3]
MLKLLKLNSEIEKVLEFQIEINHTINNCLYNGIWVTQIPEKYFDNQVEKIIKLIDESIDYNDDKNIFFINSLLDDIEEFINNLNDILDNYLKNKFDRELVSHTLVYPNNPPTISPMDLEFPSPTNNNDDKALYIIDIISGFYGKESGGNYGNIESVLEEEFNLNENEIEIIYLRAHITYTLMLHNKMVISVGKFLQDIVKVYNRRKSNIEENLLSINPENLKLEFNLSKTNLGHLFYNLYEVGIIAKDKSDTKDERTSLKNYINHANIFYLDKSTFAKAQKMTRAMPVARDTDSKEVTKEIIFLNDVVDRLNTRIDSLTNINDNLKKRNH